MATTIAPIGADTLERIARLPTGGHPVLSVYVDLDPARFPTPAERDTQLSALLAGARREDAGADADRVQALIAADKESLREAGGLAVFSSAGADVLEAVHLPGPVEPMAVVDSVPWLGPIAAMASPGEWGVLVACRTTARLLRGGCAGFTEIATIQDEVHKQHKGGGWSALAQNRFSRGIEEQVGWHIERVAEQLLREHEHQPFDHLVIVASGDLRPVVEQHLHRTLREVLAGAVDADLRTATVREIAQAVAPVMEKAEHERERALLDRVEQGLGTGGRAVAGMDEVLAMLEQERIECLLLVEGTNLRATRCPSCGRLSATGETTCPTDGETLAEVDGTKHVIDAAAARSAQVAIIRREAERLEAQGQIAALLRW